MKKVSRKHLAPIFIVDILKEYTDRDHPCTQKFICEKLSESPYDIDIERKAVGKHMKTLLLEDLLIFGNGKDGYWYDRKAYQHFN